MRICHEVVLNMLKLLSIPSLSCSIGASTSFFRASSKHAVQNGTLVFNPHFLHQIRNQNHTLHHSWCHIQVRETIPGRELHEQILIQYSHYLYGDNVAPAWPYEAQPPDEDSVMISAIMWW